MQVAAKCLREGRMSVTEVAERVGYENAGKFSAAFRQAFGCTPSAYQPGESSEQAHRERAILFDPALRKKMQSLPEKEASG